MAEAFIYDAIRTPRGKGKKDGSLADVKAVHLLGGLFEVMRERNQLDTSLVEDAIIGCVTQLWEQSGDLAKAAVMAAKYSDKVAGVTLNRFCGSGLEAVNQAAAYIMSGQTDLIMAGGVESMSRIPLGSDGSALLLDPEMVSGLHIIPQGVSADLIATKYGYSREDVDQFAVRSHKNANEAWKKGYFNRSVIPVKDINGQILLDKDETIRPGTNLEALAGLRPSFLKMGQQAGFDAMAIQKYPEIESLSHIHHAGNSSGIVDGASLMMIGSKEIAQKTGLKPRAKIRSFAITGTEPTIMLVGPGPASQKALKNAKMSVSDIDLVEVNEAFAVVPLYFMDELGIDPAIVNVNGGAIAMGHPLGATGAMLLGTVLDELERRDKNIGLATLCIGGGMGIATIIERV